MVFLGVCEVDELIGPAHLHVLGGVEDDRLMAKTGSTSRLKCRDLQVKSWNLGSLLPTDLLDHPTILLATATLFTE